MRRTGLLIAVGLGAAGLLAAFLTTQPSQVAGLLRPEDTGVISRGEVVYAENCAACHGANLEGQPNWRVPNEDGLLPAPPHDPTGHTWHHDDKTLFTLTKYGLAGILENPPPSGMPAYKDLLSDEDIIAALSYIKSTWPDEVRIFHDGLNAEKDG